MDDRAEIAFIGGTGIYDPDMLEDVSEVKIDTPYGATSDLITTGIFCGRKAAFIPRHGRRHTIPPHMINYRANIWALRELGAKRVISVSAVGSLKEEMAPRNFVIPSQFLDFTRTRKSSFTEIGRVIHISVADPFCPQLQEIVYAAVQDNGIPVHKDATYVCIEGPRFSTRAESRFFRSTGADIIGMTVVPECQLAREAQMCYVSIATITDYDVWADKPVTAKEVIDTLKTNTKNIRKVLTEIVAGIPRERSCACKSALGEAVITK